MEYIYAALILHRLGRPINEENIYRIIEAAGMTPDMIKIKALVSALQGVNIDEVLRSAVPTPTVVPAAGVQSAPAESMGAPGEEKEEEKEEKKEEEALEGLAALFG